MHTKILHPRQLPSASSGACTQKSYSGSVFSPEQTQQFLLAARAARISLREHSSCPGGASLRCPSEGGLWLMWISGFMHIGFIKDGFSAKLEREREKQNKVGEGAEHKFDLSWSPPSA